MNRRHSILWFLVLASGTLIGLFASGIPTLSAERSGPDDGTRDAPLADGDVPEIGRDLAAGQVFQQAIRSADAARNQARTRAHCATLAQGIAPAREAFYDERLAAAEGRLRALLSHGPELKCAEDPPEAIFDRARLLLANVLLQGDASNATEAVSLVDAVGADESTTPVDDYSIWLKARALEAADEPSEAADAYKQLVQREDTPLTHRARARRALMLVEAERWKDALPAIDAMLDDFPDYPRRYQLLHGRALALEGLGRLQKAAHAYQDAWFAYPQKSTAEPSRRALDRLRHKGIAVAPISRHKLFRRYRRLRINRQWELAGRLFEDLLARESTPGGHSEFEHDVIMQLALNAYYPKKNEEALEYLHQLRDAWKAGRRAGISIRLVNRYLSRTYARMGRFEDSLAALKRSMRNRGAYYRRRELAEFFSEHGHYEKAFEIVDGYYSKWRKRRWDYAWLLYRTGRFEEALERFEWLAEHRSGQSRARAMYWRARTLERQGEIEESKKGFRELTDRYRLSYYGIQAENRLLDQQQRGAVDDDLGEHTEPLVANTDKVLEEMEAAARAIAEKDSEIDYDPSMVPRTAEGGEEPPWALAARNCATGKTTNSTFCRLLAGEIPSQTEDMIQQLLPPGRPAAGHFQGGLHALKIGQNVETPPATDVPTRDAFHRRPEANRIDWRSRARIYWNGRFDSDVAFAKFEKGQAIGPFPEPLRAYTDTSYRGGLQRAASEFGTLFPELVRARWLYDIGLVKESRRAIRDVGLEYRSLVRRGKPRDGRPHELDQRELTYYIDYRRSHRGMWGHRGDKPRRFPVPEDRAGKAELADRQQAIVAKRDAIRPLLIDAMKEAGDYHLVRRFTLEKGGWYHKSPSGAKRQDWSDAYPRAFPRLVAREAAENGINPYLIWALMTAESAYNPDSVSHAEAIGLLQVIPRTGIKVASWIGDDDFGPYDLVDEDVAVSQGVHYFSSLVRKFKGQELFAIAGYNGGPHRVASWLKQRGDMPMDEFVEEIPFNEARNYVKKVLRFLAIYMQVYEGRKDLYIGQRVDLSYEPYPNF